MSGVRLHDPCDDMCAVTHSHLHCGWFIRVTRTMTTRTTRCIPRANKINFMCLIHMCSLTHSCNAQADYKVYPEGWGELRSTDPKKNRDSSEQWRVVTTGPGSQNAAAGNYMYTYMCVCVFTYVYMYTYANIYICMHIYMWICI